VSIEVSEAILFFHFGSSGFAWKPYLLSHSCLMSSVVILSRFSNSLSCFCILLLSNFFAIRMLPLWLIRREGLLFNNAGGSCFLIHGFLSRVGSGDRDRGHVLVHVRGSVLCDFVRGPSIFDHGLFHCGCSVLRMGFGGTPWVRFEVSGIVNVSVEGWEVEVVYSLFPESIWRLSVEASSVGVVGGCFVVRL
jgi:hypothetical protein